MITYKEVNRTGVKLAPEYEANIARLLAAWNIIREAYGKPMIVSSGFRSIDDHKRIYREIAARKGLKTVRIPMGSRHLSGEALDISDPRRELQKWIMKNLDICERAGLYFEDFKYTPTWVHAQIVPPKSGKRFFIP